MKKKQYLWTAVTVVFTLGMTGYTASVVTDRQMQAVESCVSCEPVGFRLVLVGCLVFALAALVGLWAVIGPTPGDST